MVHYIEGKIFYRAEWRGTGSRMPPKSIESYDYKGAKKDVVSLEPFEEA